MEDAALLDKSVDLLGLPYLELDVAVAVQRHGGELDFVGGQLGAVGGLAQDLEGQLLGVLKIEVVLVLLLEDGLGTGVVCADAGGLPAGVVAGRVARVQLEAVSVVVAGKEKRDAERPQPTVLGVALLQVAHLLYYVLERRLLVVHLEVLLRRFPHVVDQDAGVGRHPGHAAQRALVQDIHLLGARVLFEQLARHLPLRHQRNAVLRHDPDGRAGVVDRLQRVFNLVESPLGGENRRSAVVSSGHLRLIAVRC